MAFTGQNFSDQIDITSDLAYSTYFDPAKKNALIKESLIKMVSLKYATMDTQAEYDELYQFIITNQPVVSTTNTISISPTGVITDYFHLLAIKPVFSKLLEIKVVTATNTSTIIVTFNKKSLLRTGTGVIFSGATGNTNLNGTRYLKQLNSLSYSVFSDEKLTIPVVGNGDLSGTVITQVIFKYNFATQYISGRKGSGFHVPTLFTPKFEIGNGVIKIYPLDITCSLAYVDYMKKPLDSQLPDITNNVIDLEQTYSLRFLYYWKDEVVKLYKEQMMELQAMQVQNQEIINP